MRIVNSYSIYGANSKCTIVNLQIVITLKNTVFTISPQHKNGNIANFVLGMSFKIKKTNKVGINAIIATFVCCEKLDCSINW